MAEFAIFSILYWIAYFLERNGFCVLSACLLMGTGLVLFILFARKFRSIFIPPAVFSISWIFCIGIACLKLSNLQAPWETATYIVFFLIYLCFTAAFSLFYRYSIRIPAFPRALGHSENLLEISESQLKRIICIYTCISVVSFLLEALILGFVPLFTVDTPHAYSTFHVSGLHYFTVLFVLIPALCVMYFRRTGKSGSVKTVCFCLFLSLLLPFLLISRFQLIFSVGLALITFLLQNRKNLQKFINLRNILLAVGSVLLLLSAYVFITVERAHSVEYLNGIFEMKNPELPIFISQPYIYIANNFENFNCLISRLSEHSNGLKMAFPFFALTGLKFVVPELLSFPLYITKEELTTVTMFYDAYYDFGITGIILFSVFLGILYASFCRFIEKSSNELLLLCYAQLLMYLCLAFFTTWFSNPTTWFYLGIILVTAFILWYSNRKQFRKGSV